MANGDASSMGGIWSHGGAVMHPIGGREIGWNAVRGSFEQVHRLSSDGKIDLKDPLIQVAGDSAYEVGMEHGQIKMGRHGAKIDHCFPNIYRRVARAWTIVHHQANASPAMLEVLSRL